MIPSLRLCGWLGFGLTILFAGLLLSWRIPLVSALMHGLLIVGWYQLHVTALLPQNTIPLVIEVACLLFGFSGATSALFSWSTTKAIHQADRAAELAPAHEHLQEQPTALQRLQAHLESLVVTDPLTSVANHRGMVLALDQEIARLCPPLL